MTSGRDTIALAAKLATGANVAEDWNGFALLHNAASRVGGIDIGFVPHDGGVCSADQIGLAGKGELDVLFLLGADEYDTSAMGKAFVVYIGSHGDAGAHRADVILPGATYTEKSGTYVNTEGRVQQTNRAGFAPGETLTASHFRFGPLKRLAPTGMLVALDSAAQIIGGGSEGISQFDVGGFLDT